MTALDALTDRQREVAQLVAEGYSTPEIAERLCVTEVAIKSLLSRIYLQLDITTVEGYSSRVKLARLVWEASVAELVDAMLAEREAA